MTPPNPGGADGPRLFDVAVTPTLPAHLSASSAALFEQCPARWRFRYVERRSEPSGAAAVCGTFAHLVLEDLMGLPAGRRRIDEARRIARSRWETFAHHPDVVELGLNADEARALRWVTWRAIEGLWALEDPDTVEVASTERRITTTVGTVPFLGVIDRVDTTAGGPVISDYKSGRAPQTRYRDAKLRQVLWYAAAVAAADGTTPTKARLLYLGDQIIDVDCHPDVLAAAIVELDALWARITAAVDTDTFDPAPGPLCGWCPHVTDCAAGTAEVKVRIDQGRMRTDAPAVAALAAA